MRRVLTLPSEGRLIVATDLQGNVRDFERVASLFESSYGKTKGKTWLVVTGDLVHGPELERSDWPEYLGSYYVGDSKRLLELAKKLQARYPNNVTYLLGNHEHAHVGGPVVSKFFPDEAQRLEEIVGDEGSVKMREWFRGWPFVAVAPKAKLVMLHAAPHARLRSVAELERLPLELVQEEELAVDGDDPYDFRSILAALLWARTTSTERARSFLEAVHPGARVAIYGHDVARAGHAIDREPLLCISTSFGCFDGDKLYFEWDLASEALSATDAADRGLRPLYPTAPRVYRP
jgi:hypothetical protein